MSHQFAVVFPGQGSQMVGMLSDVAAQYTEVQQTFEEASMIFGEDLWKISQHGPAEQLDKTTYTQPILLAASVAVWRILAPRMAAKPACMAGHSLGEYTALVCAEALPFADAVALVATRARAMQAAVLPDVGAMGAIIGLEDVDVKAICEAVSSTAELVSPANFNSIGQVVVAGHRAAVLAALSLAKEKGSKIATLIPVSVPSHCELMRPAASQLAAALAGVSFAKTSIPVINNVNVIQYTSAESLCEGLTKQLYLPVRWVETIQKMIEMGVTQIIECGPGKVLTGLNKRIDNTLALLSTSDIKQIEAVLHQVVT
ncbi:MAG TPA: ACP S-malonyltransferase [Gammaproteobacteria bacterium]|jgi:[acyl-carrier-protein] S-malonyltransferase|nr:ACP S-malonyltransferase [Gammaproteobacteria bacterium]